MSRFTWVEDRTAAIDRLLSTNGAHSAPPSYKLMCYERHVATVAFKNGQWVFWTVTRKAQGKARNVERAKEMAKLAAREEYLIP